MSAWPAASPARRDLGQFWRNLVDGVECISRFTDEEVAAAGIEPALSSQPHYVKAGGVLEGAEWFDAHFFGIYPREAEIMDPQHRVFLEVAWHALEHAGYDPAAYEATGTGSIGVYAGCGFNTYLIYNLAQNREIRENVQGYQLTIANDKDFLPTRVAYKLNLRGPPSTCRRPAPRRSSPSTWPARRCSAATATWRWPAACRCGCRNRAAICTRKAASCRPTGTAGRSTRRPRARSAATASASSCSSG